MEETSQLSDSGICPYLDSSDIRCEEYLSLRHLPDAFEHCICNCVSCPVFLQITNEQSNRKESGEPITAYA